MSALPVRVRPRPGQALDSYLEHLADVNQLTTAQLIGLLRAGGAPTRYLPVAPDPRLLSAVADLAGLDVRDLHGSALAHHALTDISTAGVQAAGRYGHRAIAAKGWVFLHGTQVCPTCLATDRSWQTVWRLPIVTTCTAHGNHLVTFCPGCRRPPRDGRHSHLRPVGADTRCGNPLGAGPLLQCQHDLASINATAADPDSVARQRRTNSELAGEAVYVLGSPAPARQYLRDLRGLCVLLLHLASQPTASDHAPWAGLLHDELATRTDQRGPRWGVRPPTDTTVRAAALDAADQILSRDLETAGSQLAAWFSLIPATNDGPLGWLADRTTMTPTLTRLVTTGLAPYRRISHHLDTRPLLGGRPVHHIPQVLPTDLYEKYLSGLIDRADLTGRTYASLCLARAAPEVRTWAEAAERLGLPATIGTNTARACSARLTVPTDEFTRRLALAAEELPRLDYQALEATITRRVHMSRWFAEWVRIWRPETRDSDRLHAITWLWIHAAHAHPDTAPTWDRFEDPRTAKTQYRGFESSLTGADERSLTSALHKRA